LFTPWAGHGLGLVLKPDGTGTLSEASGASESEQWAFTWSPGPDRSAQVTLATRSRTGDGAGNNKPGDQFIATVGQSRGDTVLNMTPLHGGTTIILHGGRLRARGRLAMWAVIRSADR
jgi:hypothetical protein